MDRIDKTIITTIIFDLDQTLVDRRAIFVNFLRGQHERWAEKFADTGADQYIRFILSLDNNGYSDKATIYQQVASKFGLNDDAGPALYADYTEFYGASPVLYPGVHQLLTRLAKQYKLGLISKGRTIGQTRKIEQTNIRGYFETILVSETEGIKKPDTRIFERCLQRMNVQAAHAIYIGDNPVNDIEPPRSLGMQAIWVDQGIYEPTAAANAVIQEIAELEEIL